MVLGMYIVDNPDGFFLERKQEMGIGTPRKNLEVKMGVKQGEVKSSHYRSRDERF